MATQTYETHRHNPKLTGIGFLCLVAAALALTLAWLDVGRAVMIPLGVAALMASNLTLLAISRVYTTKLQDRIIRLEMALRGARVLSPSQQATLSALSRPQVVALRFASDAELPALVERADRERLTADQIKRAIAAWVPDLDRT